MPTVFINQRLLKEADISLYQATITKFIQGENKHGLHLEKLQQGIYSIRANNECRLILISKKIQGQQAWLWVMTLPQHQYEHLKQKPPAWFKNIQEAELTNLETDDLITNTTTTQAIEFQPSSDTFFYNQQWIFLDKTQSNIRQIALPALVSGGPGTGKSCISFAKILQFIEHLPAYSKAPLQALYVTESQELLDEMQRMFNEHIDLGLIIRPANCSIHFKTTTQIASENSAVSKDYAFFSIPEEMIKTDLSQYLTTQVGAEKKKRNKNAPTEQSIELMYQEIRALSGYSSLNDYEKAVGSHSLFPEKQHKEWLWNVYVAYRKKILDLKIKFSGEPIQYDLVVVDEVQDLWRLCIKLLAKLAKNHQIFYCVGDHQSLYDSEFIVPFIKTLHWNAKPSLNHQVLQAVYRCSQNVVEVANAVLQMSAFLTGEDRYQVATIQAGEDAKDAVGDAFWLTKETEITTLFQQNEFFVVVLPEEFSEPTKQETLKKLFGDKLVLTVEQFKAFSGPSEAIAGIAFTIKQIKGLGFANVFIYQPLQHDTRFIEANKKFPNEFDFHATTKTHKGLKKGQENIHLRPAFNGLFVELTRTTGNVFIFQPHEKSITNLSQNLAKFIKTRKNKAAPKLVDITTEQKTAEIEQVRQLIQTKPEPVIAITAPVARSSNSREIRKTSAVATTRKNTNFFTPVAEPVPKKTAPKASAGSSNNLEVNSRMLFTAINLNNLELIKELLTKSPNLANYGNLFGPTPLHFAAQTGRLKVVKLLLANGANINCTMHDGSTPLYLAAQKGYLEIVKYLIENKANVNNVANDGTTPLHAAAHKNLFEIVELLLANGAAVNYTSPIGVTSLQYAVQNGHLKMVKLLIANGANVHCIYKDGTTMLHYAAYDGHLEIVETLIENGADVNRTSQGGLTPLYRATENKHFEVIKLLLANKANVNCTMHDGSTPLYFAAQKGYLEIAKYLIAYGADVNCTRPDGTGVLHVASLNNHLEIVKLLLVHEANINCATQDGFTPLHIAAQFGHFKIVKFLIENGADIHRTINNGATPLQCAIQNGHFALVKLLKAAKSEQVSQLIQSDPVPTIASSSAVASSSNSLEVNFQTLCNAIQTDNLGLVKLLLTKNPNLINQASKNGLSPLHAAVLFGCLEIAKYLIEHKAKINCTTHDGFTPLHEAAKYDHFTIAKLLIENNADVNCTTHAGQTPLHEAAQNNHLDIVKCLIKNEAEVNCTAHNGAIPLHFAAQKGHLAIVMYLIKNKAKVNAHRKDGTTPLHGAANCGALDVVIYLIENGADVNCATQIGITPLFYAAQNGHLKVVECLIKNRTDVNYPRQDGTTPLYIAAQNGHLDVVKLLIQQRAEVNCAVYNGQTPLQDAAYGGNLAMVKLLVENGAKVNCASHNGATPLHVAAEQNHLDIVKFLVENQADISRPLVNGETPLILAKRNNHSQIIKYLETKVAETHASSSVSFALKQ